ncbi:MAG TPA: 23S rRNA (adenine(2503)-C(2))-methyltransferase RlmN [Anaerolineae bacterium]|nr:23S rRNA (adenine(2503)-C(2))-methyltransferase RlmN [Anaerolineae bacterium]
MSLPYLYDLDLPTLEAWLADWGEPRYRARQIWEWLYRRLVTDVDQMTSLPKSLRQRLTEATRLTAPHIQAVQESLDGETRKDLLALEDGEQIEVVLMRYADRRSVCVSTQVGCAVGCQFCATGQMGFRRNLSSGEIVMQVLHFARLLEAQGQKLTNVVLMGMGEPFLNYENTLAALHRLIDSQGFQMGQRRLTVSTAGVAPGIRRFSEEDTQVNLAVSLHAATDALRNILMPLNRRYGLDEVFAAVTDYIARTNRRVTFEWSLIDGVNDTPEQALALAARIKGMLAHINLIPLNPTPGYAGQPSTPEHTTNFTAILDEQHIPYTLRLRRGLDIQAGCGQLRQSISQS